MEQPYTTQEAAKTMAYSLVISRIDFCNGLLINLLKSQIYEIKVIMNHTARSVVRKKNTPMLTYNLTKLGTCLPCDETVYLIGFLYVCHHLHYLSIRNKLYVQRFSVSKLYTNTLYFPERYLVDAYLGYVLKAINQC